MMSLTADYIVQELVTRRNALLDARLQYSKELERLEGEKQQCRFNLQQIQGGVVVVESLLQNLAQKEQEARAEEAEVPGDLGSDLLDDKEFERSEYVGKGAEPKECVACPE